MAYIGKGLDNGVRNQFVFAATQGQTSFSGSDSDGKTLAMTDILYVDCYQNGVKLKPTTDYTLTSTTLTLVNAASLNDVINIVSFDIFAVPDTVPASTGGTFSGDVAMGVGSNITLDSSIGANATTAFASMDGRIFYSNDYSDAPRGPNKVVLQNDNTWISGLGISSNSLDIYSGGDIKFNKSTSSTAYTKQVTILSGGGIAFNNDTAAANALDDYEEGTWTPVDTNGQVSLTVYTAFYTKIGRKVFVEMGILISSNSNSNSVNFSGLPFTAIGGNDNTGGFALVGTSSGRNDLWLVGRATNRIGCSTNLNVDVPFSSYSNKQIKICGSYTTA
jgi:hypothetical protein